jgi:hypothetical protein
MSKRRKHESYSIEPRGSDFAVNEWTNGYEIVHKATGRRHWMSDGVDMFKTPSGRSLFPGTPAFNRAMTSMLIHDQENLYEAYFPDLDAVSGYFKSSGRCQYCDKSVIGNKYFEQSGRCPHCDRKIL